jgi:tRNA(Ile)-lysidine synthase
MSSAPRAPAPNAATPPADPGAAGGAVRAVHRAVRRALRGAAPGSVLLAVSGGRDSMTLLDAAVAVARDRLAGVATFDHGTGEAARRAVHLVRRAAAAYGLRLFAGRAALPDAGEAAWRAARWRFLRRAARRAGAAVVATAHTADDQVETVVLALLRDAGPRGLAGLAVRRRRVRRPLLACSAATVAAYAAARRVRWIEDPSNARLDARRNRVRHELLPALVAVRPALRDELLALGSRAAAWRREVRALVAALPVTRDADGARSVPLAALAALDDAALAVVWPALVARTGVPLDRRGLARLVAFTRRAAAAPRGGARAPAAGGVEATVVRARDAWALRVERRPAALAGVAWRLEPADPRPAEDAWTAALPGGRAYAVRAWRPGDRLERELPGGARRARRVKRYLAEARVAAPARAGWPVVVALDADGCEASVVWIPGVPGGAPAPVAAGPTTRGAGPAATFRCARHAAAQPAPAPVPPSAPRDAA